MFGKPRAWESINLCRNFLGVRCRRGSDRLICVAVTWSTCDMVPYEIFKVKVFFSKCSRTWLLMKCLRGGLGESRIFGKVYCTVSCEILEGAGCLKVVGAPYLCEGFLYKPASISNVLEVEGCDFIPLPVKFLGLHQQNQLKLGKTFRET